MSYKNFNQINIQKQKRVAIVLSNPTVSTITGIPVGFWWSELTHPYFSFTEKGYNIEIFSYTGGECKADTVSNPEDTSQWQSEDVISRGYIHDLSFMKLLNNTKSAKDIFVEDFDAILIAGGQGPMFTMEKAVDIQKKFVEFYEAGKITAALCHGVAILRYAKLSNGEYLVKGKTVTGFTNDEEAFIDHKVWSAKLLPKGKHIMPWRIEDALKNLGANYIQAGLWREFAIRDRNLITGQQNYSGTETAALIIKALGE